MSIVNSLKRLSDKIEKVMPIVLFLSGIGLAFSDSLSFRVLGVVYAMIAGFFAGFLAMRGLIDSARSLNDELLEKLFMAYAEITLLRRK